MRASCFSLKVKGGVRVFAPLFRPRELQTRSLLTLAIETSCDDTSVAILEKHNGALATNSRRPQALLHFHEKVTADNRIFKGISPIPTLESHQENLANLVKRALSRYSSHHGSALRPDFISVTRGPGMRSAVNIGLDTAKGLAVAYNVPLLGVNHMQAHALTPRLVSALKNSEEEIKPEFPFLSLLVSGGHTMILNSQALDSHQILASTADIAMGDALDKIAREVLPEDIVKGCKDVSYARELESFVFSAREVEDYIPPLSSAEERTRSETRWGWSLPIPFGADGSHKVNSMELSFSGLDSAVRRTVAARRRSDLSCDERKELGYEAMRIAFEHAASRCVSALTKLNEGSQNATGDADPHGGTSLNTLVVSGGVAANMFLRIVFRRYLDVRGLEHVGLQFPPIEFCTDNAAMIAWTGMEMYEAGWESDLSIRSLRKWTLDPISEDGGILGVGGWKKRA